MGQGRETQRKKVDSLGRLLLGRKGYGCVRLLGEGAFSRVYCVEDKADGRIYACKISENMKLLQQEAEVMAVLEHPMFPVYFGFWRETGLGFLLSEYVSGCSLEEMLKRRGYFTAGQTIRVGLALAEVLQYLHERPERFLFRDVKPSNIMVCQGGRVKLIDFGCVCSMEERVSSKAGTPGFAAPEQLTGEGELTPACDVYGLGRTMEAMLGTEADYRIRMKTALDKITLHKKGFSGERFAFMQRYADVTSMMEKRKRKRLWRIVDTCTRKEISQRIPDMEQVSLALRRLMIEDTADVNVVR